jgi:glycosyltransferase involved in cell wall biosynthesis
MNQPLVSIIINNFNYARFLGQCIESALAQTYSKKEIIVVDDGSTDNSQEIIRSFGSRITPFFNSNGGQYTALNTGFQASQGDWVMFLDSDDFLDPKAIDFASVFFSKPQISKIQFCMQWVNEVGNMLPKINPFLKEELCPRRIKHWYFQSGSYPCSPGSGNLYKRDFLKGLFPLDNSCLSDGDSILLACAVVTGDIYTVRKPLVFYRRHGRNDSSASNIGSSFFCRETHRAILRFNYARAYAANRNIFFSSQALNRGLHFLQLRITSLMLCGKEHPIPGDHPLLVYSDAFRAFFIDQPLSWTKKLAALTYIFLISLAPSGWAHSLANIRYRQ